MAMEDIVGIIFEDIEEVKPILSDSEGNDLEGNDLSEAILEYGISEGKYNAPHCQDGNVSNFVYHNLCNPSLASKF